MKTIPSLGRGPTVACITCSLIVIVQVLLAQFSCGSGLGCSPQYTLQMASGPNSMVSMVQGGIKLVSYLAKDFSVEEDKNVRYVIADTLNENNVFRFNYGGFCRMNAETREQNCTAMAQGINFMTCLMSDFGTQLKQITKVKDAGQFVDGLTTTYTAFARKVMKGTYESIEWTVRVLHWLNYTIILLSVVLITLYVFWMRRSIIALCSLIVAAHLCILYVEIYFIERTHYKLSPRVHVLPGTGLFLVVFSTLISGGQLVYGVVDFQRSKEREHKE